MLSITTQCCHLYLAYVLNERTLMTGRKYAFNTCVRLLTVMSKSRSMTVHAHTPLLKLPHAASVVHSKT